MLTNTRRMFSRTVALTALALYAGNGLARSKKPDDSGDEELSTGWPTYRGTIGRTGSTTDRGPASSVTTAWQMDLGGGMVTAEPVVANNTLYLSVTTANSPSQSRGYIAAYDPQTGDELWKRDDFPAVKTPTVTANTLHVATSVNPESDSAVGGLFALDLETGETKWKRDEHVAWADPIVIDDRVYTIKQHRPEDPGSSVQALNANTGDTIWQTDDVEGSVCYVDETIFATSGTTLNAADGTVSWEIADDVEGSNHIIHAVSNGLVYGVIQEEGSTENIVMAWSSDDGSVQWTSRTGIDGHWVGRLTVGEGRVFFRTANGTDTIRALNAETGKEIWTYEAESELASDLTVADGILYAGGRTNTDSDLGDAVVVAVNAVSGEREWRSSFGQWELDEYGPAANAPIIADEKVGRYEQ